MPDDYTESYLAFYDAYPRHEGKRDGFKAWKGMPLASQQVALADVEKRNRHNAWSKNKKLVPLPATYLRGARYEDDWFATFKSEQNEDKPNTGQVEYRTPEPQGPIQECKWLRCANFFMLRWVWRRAQTGKALSLDEMRDAVRLRNRLKREVSADMQAEIDSGTPTSEVTRMYGTLMLDWLDERFECQLRSRILG